MNYEKMWKEHKQWINSGVMYYTELLEAFEQSSGEAYDKVSNQLATFEFQLDRMEREERLEEKNYNKV